MEHINTFIDELNILNNKYEELYEDINKERDLEVDIINLLNKIEELYLDNIEDIFINIAKYICINNIPIIEQYIDDFIFTNIIKTPLTVYNSEILKYHKEYIKSNKFKYKDRVIINLQTITESLWLYIEYIDLILNINSKEKRKSILIEMIDSILNGYVYIVGSKDRRIILNWIIKELIQNCIIGEEPLSIFHSYYLNETIYYPLLDL